MYSSVASRLYTVLIRELAGLVATMKNIVLLDMSIKNDALRMIKRGYEALQSTSISVLHSE